MSPAANVTAHKRQHPHLYCADPRCLWKTVARDGPRPCPRHRIALVPGDGRRASFDVPLFEMVPAPQPKKEPVDDGMAEYWARIAAIDAKREEARTCDCLYDDAHDCCRHKQAARGPSFVIEGARCSCACHGPMLGGAA